jgi:hypothetical protein
MIRKPSQLERDVKMTKIYLELHGGRPAELLLDEGIIRITPTDSLRARNVVDWEVLVIEAKYNLSHLIHAYHFITSNVDWLTEIRLGQPITE